MGVDLKIMPVRYKKLTNPLLCYERLSFDRDYRIFGQIKGGRPSDLEEDVVVETYPLPPGVILWLYKDEGIEKTRKDPYGDEIEWTTKEQLMKIKLPEDASEYNRAIFKFLETLPGDMPILIEWS